MCEQCSAETVMFHKPIVDMYKNSWSRGGIRLVRATKYGSMMRPGEYGLVVMNDPDVFFPFNYNLVKSYLSDTSRSYIMSKIIEDFLNVSINEGYKIGKMIAESVEYAEYAERTDFCDFSDFLIKSIISSIESGIEQDDTDDLDNSKGFDKSLERYNEGNTPETLDIGVTYVTRKGNEVFMECVYNDIYYIGKIVGKNQRRIYNRFNGFCFETIHDDIVFEDTMEKIRNKTFVRDDNVLIKKDIDAMLVW